MSVCEHLHQSDCLCLYRSVRYLWGLFGRLFCSFGFGGLVLASGSPIADAVKLLLIRLLRACRTSGSPSADAVRPAFASWFFLVVLPNNAHQVVRHSTDADSTTDSISLQRFTLGVSEIGLIPEHRVTGPAPTK